ncbi:SpoIID/LytB domain-containing protein [Nocardioides cynanchi]|uniref:SpoIID/LytB domain-containing protein n=1 Tax=Nocardioides cynanchi TaxID=2558918 RepID=UPI0012464831|nr:SpoIID/LytB domain-containing protein [Nocardioides cynanchi]
MSTLRHTSIAATGLAGLLALSGAGLGHATAAATSTPALQVPDNAVITIDGRGFGHGHGLSQYGAEGAARQGLSARKILHFYYPGTRSGQQSGRVRVLITAGIGKPTIVLAGPGLKVHDLQKGTTTPVPTRGPAARATQWRMAGDGAGGTAVSYRTGAWHVWRTLPGNGEFRSARAALTLVVGGSRTSYRGTLQSLAPVSKATHRITVNRVSLEGYVRGVVPREMPTSWHQAALQAQAVAARTYAAFEAVNPYDTRFNLCDTSSCQVYGGLSAENPRTGKAVTRTAGQVRLFHGQPAFTQFSSSNGGWTSDGGQPYLSAEKDPYDGWPGNLVHTWSTAVTSRSIEKAFPGVGNLRSIAVTQRDGNGQWGGRVEVMNLRGSKRNLVVSGDDFRSALGLRSTWFDLAKAAAG